jgi:hypothetical protein
LGFITDFLIEYPYFLPCFAATCISLVCWVLGLLFMKETLYLKTMAEDVPKITSNEEQEQEPLLVNIEDEGEYSTFVDNTGEQERYKNKKNNFFRDVFTPQVLAISMLYSIVAFQMLYFDGNY